MKNLLLILCGLIPIWVVGQDRPATKTDSLLKNNESIFSYLQQENILRVHFFGHLDALNRYEEDKEKHKAKMVLLNAPSKKTSWKVKLEQRGKLRKDICKVKPLRIDFSKKQLTKRKLAAVDKVKMVVPCDKTMGSSQQLLKEYLAYRLYNLLTEKSYQVQLLEATFEDSLSQKNYEVYGFLLEPTKVMGFRNGVHVSKNTGNILEELYEKEYLLFSIFQYFIGNTDWNIARTHNVKFMESSGHKRTIPIPYDFDFSGIVNAPYATLDANLPIKDITERLFMGSYKEEALLKEVIQLFHDKKPLMKELVLGFEYLEEKERQNMWDYLEKFFIQTNNQNELLHIFPKETAFQDIMDLDKRKG